MHLFGAKPYKRPRFLNKRVIGRGGASVRIQRWLDTRSKSAVVAKTVAFKELAIAEAETLKRAEAVGVPRVVKLLDALEGFAGRTHLILELVDGFTLEQYSDWRKAGILGPDWDFESNMMTIAVQLLETLSKLHDEAHVAHLDVKVDNVMMSQKSVVPWDTLKLIDFGISSFCSADPKAKDVSIIGTCCDRAAPENVQAFVSQPRQIFCPRTCKINGPASDMWSAGILLFEMLTGHLPFDLNAPDGNIPSMKEGKGVFRTLMAMWSFWSNACVCAEFAKDIKHPLVERIKACSATPELAADFFIKTFAIMPNERLTAAEALAHPYLADCLQEMQRSRQGKPQCGHLRTQSEAATLLRRKASLSTRVGRESAKMAQGIAQGLVRFATPPQHREPKQLKEKKQRQPPCDLDWYFPPYVMLERSAAKPAPYNAAAKPQPTAPEHAEVTLDAARDGDMHDSAQSLSARCKGQKDVREVKSSSSETTGIETAPSTAKTDKAHEVLQPVKAGTSDAVTHGPSQLPTVPPQSASASKPDPASTAVTAPLDGLLLKPSKYAAALSVSASCVSPVPGPQHQDSAFQTAAQSTAKVDLKQVSDEEVPVSAEQPEGKKGSWWGRSAKALGKWGKRCAVGAVLVGTGLAVAAAARK